MNKQYKLDFVSPISVLEIISSDDAVISIMFADRKEPINHQETIPSVLQICWDQLKEYFEGKRQTFTFAYRCEGTSFQRTVWEALTEIPYAKTVSYQHIASAIKNEKAIRAVGNANGKNKLSIVIPCHRIIGSNGKLTGYAGGLWRKEWLLNHEKKQYD